MNKKDVIQADTGLNKFYSKIYIFLAMGVGISALVSYALIYVFPEILIAIVNIPLGFFGLWIAEIALVLYLGMKAQQNPTLAIGGFIGYSILNGMTLSITLLMYAQSTIYIAFLSAAVTFGAMSLVGIFSKKDLSGIGRAAYSALIGIIIAMLLNVFILKSSAVDLFISLLMVLIFSGITAYDNQRIAQRYEQSNGQAGTGEAVFFALQLYLDFINLFLAFLRIFGRK